MRAAALLKWMVENMMTSSPSKRTVPYLHTPRRLQQGCSTWCPCCWRGPPSRTCTESERRRGPVWWQLSRLGCCPECLLIQLQRYLKYHQIVWFMSSGQIINILYNFLLVTDSSKIFLFPVVLWNTAGYKAGLICRQYRSSWPSIQWQHEAGLKTCNAGTSSKIFKLYCKRKVHDYLRISVRLHQSISRRLWTS